MRTASRPAVSPANHNRPRFYTAWTQIGHRLQPRSAVGSASSNVKSVEWRLLVRSTGYLCSIPCLAAYEYQKSARVSYRHVIV